MNQSVIEELVNEAVDDLIQHDEELLILNANERCITHKLGCYLQNRVPNHWTVDVEYNREGHDESIKWLPQDCFSEEPSSEKDERQVFPDIIVHQRGEKENLLVIEAKKNADLDTKDSQKVEGYVRHLKYRFGMCVSFITGKCKDGKRCDYWFYPFPDQDKERTSVSNTK